MNIKDAPNTLLALFGAILLVELLPIFSFPDIKNVYRLLFICAVMYFVLSGSKGARIFFIFLLFLGSGSLTFQIYNRYESLTNFGISLFLIPNIILITTIAYLLFSSNAKAYFLESQDK